MENKKGINFFFGIIAIILGATLFKHFNFKTLTFKDPAIDILYLVVFVISIYWLIKDYKKRPEK